MFKGDGGSGSGGGRGGGGGGQGEAVASLMKKYQDLKEEYRLYRKKAMHAIQVQYIKKKKIPTCFVLCFSAVGVCMYLVVLVYSSITVVPVYWRYGRCQPLEPALVRGNRHCSAYETT